MKRHFYNPSDPFRKNNSSNKETNLDILFNRLLIVEQKMNTTIAKRIAKKRTNFLNQFLKQLHTELKESKII
jgi:uncharacterized protein